MGFHELLWENAGRNSCTGKGQTRSGRTEFNRHDGAGMTDIGLNLSFCLLHHGNKNMN